MPSYLQKRRRRHYAVLEIPQELRPRFQGKPRFVKSLDTESLTIAQRRVGEVVREWKADLDRARAAVGRPVSGLDDDAAYFARALKQARTEAARDAVLEHIAVAADAIGYATVEHVGQSPSSSPEAREFFAKATAVQTTDRLDDWLAEPGRAAKTLDMHKSDVKRFAAKFPTLGEINRGAVKKWVGALANDEKLSPKTIQRVLSALRGYWRHLQAEGAAPDTEEPFAKLDVARQAKSRSRGTAELRQPFDPADVPKLVQGALDRKDAEMADLIRLAMWSGCRIEELCALKIADVNGDSFRVREAKSNAGVRVVPVHPELKPVLARLIGDRKVGYVLAGLTENKYGDRSNAVGKRFGRMRTALKFGPQLVFHSIRKTVATLLENAGVSEGVAADILGHEKQTITYGLYSGGATLAVKAAALAKLSYPASP